MQCIPTLPTHQYDERGKRQAVVPITSWVVRRGPANSYIFIFMSCLLSLDFRPTFALPEPSSRERTRSHLFLPFLPPSLPYLSTVAHRPICPSVCPMMLSQLPQKPRAVLQEVDSSRRHHVLRALQILEVARRDLTLDDLLHAMYIDIDNWTFRDYHTQEAIRHILTSGSIFEPVVVPAPSASLESRYWDEERGAFCMQAIRLARRFNQHGSSGGDAEAGGMDGAGPCHRGEDMPDLSHALRPPADPRARGA